MRLTAELITNAPVYVNPVREREMNLRGYKISVIENLGVTQDLYETIDLSDNEITQLANFPTLKRLQCLLVNNNRVRKIIPHLGDALPNLDTLILSNNKISKLEQLNRLRYLPKLVRVSLLNNPVCKTANYRLFVIHKLPKLKVLDFQKVKPKERAAAMEMFGKLSADGGEGEANGMQDDDDGDDGDVKEAQQQAPKKVQTEEERSEIMAAIEKATTLEEVERLEKMLLQQ